MSRKKNLSLYELVDIHILYIGIMGVVLTPIVLHKISVKFGYLTVSEVFYWMLSILVVLLSPMILGKFFERKRRDNGDSTRYLLANYLLIFVLCFISTMIFSYVVT